MTHAVQAPNVPIHAYPSIYLYLSIYLSIYLSPTYNVPIGMILLNHFLQGSCEFCIGLNNCQYHFEVYQSLDQSVGNYCYSRMKHCSSGSSWLQHFRRAGVYFGRVGRADKNVELFGLPISEIQLALLTQKGSPSLEPHVFAPKNHQGPNCRQPPI